MTSGRAEKARYRYDIPDEGETEVLIESCVDRIGRSYQQQRIAVRCRAHHGLGGEVGAGTWPVLDNKLLTEPRRQPLSHQPGKNIGRAAGSKAYEQAHRPRRIDLSASDSRHGREGGSARSETQKLTTWKQHRTSSAFG